MVIDVSDSSLLDFIQKTKARLSYRPAFRPHGRWSCLINAEVDLSNNTFKGIPIEGVGITPRHAIVKCMRTHLQS